MELRNFFKKNNSKNSAQNSCEFNQKNTHKNERDFEKKNNKFLKVFGCVALATFMGATALFAAAPFGPGAASAAAESEMTAQEKLASGTLNLNPETDPVVCTTKNGIEIRYAKSSLDYGTGSTYLPSKPNNLPAGSASTPAGLNGYAYFKMGNYNWIIIGYNTTDTAFNATYTYADAITFSTYLNNPAAYCSFAYLLETQTPAGQAISNSTDHEIIYANLALSKAVSYSAATFNDTELDPGEILCLCQTSAGSVTANDAYYGNASNPIRVACENLYDPSSNKNGAGFSTNHAALIVPKTLTNSGSSSTTGYLFPLAALSTESFYINTYLSTPEKRNGGFVYFLRSVSLQGTSSIQIPYACAIDGDGAFAIVSLLKDNTRSIRPAMVIKL